MENDNVHIIQLLLSKGNADVNVLDEVSLQVLFNILSQGLTICIEPQDSNFLCN